MSPTVLRQILFTDFHKLKQECLNIDTHKHTHTHMYIYVYVYTYMCVYIYIFTDIYVYIYIYIFFFSLSRGVQNHLMRLKKEFYRLRM